MKIKVNYVVSKETEIDEETYKNIMSNNEETIEKIRQNAVKDFTNNRKNNYDVEYVLDIENYENFIPLYES